MKRWGKNTKTVPGRIPGCFCTDRRTLRMFKNCHGTRDCCGFAEGDQCMEVGEW